MKVNPKKIKNAPYICNPYTMNLKVIPISNTHPQRKQVHIAISLLFTNSAQKGHTAAARPIPFPKRKRIMKANEL